MAGSVAAFKAATELVRGTSAAGAAAFISFVSRQLLYGICGVAASPSFRSVAAFPADPRA